MTLCGFYKDLKETQITGAGMLKLTHRLGLRVLQVAAVDVVSHRGQ